ncbi:hypothetical protein LTR10_016885 [Elasticomyces elasticus]|uniref:6-phosphogluconate dehydrogenase, decarboxylating n=1 Tax=Exophiala sideris TaxID=1016849 RepID=A0ABR0JKL6_9EURO|nr:hypothetical protein LTR10_016885 [Elasticomyces elasticus]KAK5035346.1 hypothetical protein LTS07_002782 [Exophiala sideris]KAK5039303.1 hypothetical protein LTR13_003560 [Exophiala sideris]KAK5066270.1 hypothetical protein LTR69_002788 [Exophiala sideris]KAK5186947.1 hypothetical protein LTR44_000953 [Eurotiomycetes sp. CCFEE 6388]
MAKNDGPEFKKLGMCGTGSMGGMMSLLYAENGVDVYYFDPDEKNVKKLQDEAKAVGLDKSIHSQKDYNEMCKSLESGDEPKFFVYSIPHGGPGDAVLNDLRPNLKKGDIILDCSNEYWKNTERRQKELEPDGIHYIGCGVSGGYQSARSGPSMSPGGDPETLKKILPFLERVAAKDGKGRPCVTPIGPHGSGHYVKMLHNGIEQGMMSSIAEIWFIMHKCMGMEFEQIGDVFESWNKDGLLHDNFLVSIGSDINRTKKDDGSFVLSEVMDKVVQDADDSEGTGIWTCEEAVRLHVPAPTILSAHMFRLGSSDAVRRLAVNKVFGGGVKPGTFKIDIQELQLALYASFLLAFIQGLQIIKAMDREQGWKLDYRKIIQIWRGGCIIQSDHISDVLDSMLGRDDHNDDALLANHEIASELTKAYTPLKNVVLKAIEADAYVPALSASLEYYKYSSSTLLPTQFMEAELDYFGEHMYEKWSEYPGEPAKKGPHHYEWKRATGKVDQKKENKL